MTGHSENPSTEMADQGDAINQERTGESNTESAPRLSERLRYCWSLAVAGALLVIFVPPVILVSWLAGRPQWVYSWAVWGARTWLRLSDVEVVVRGRENLEASRAYVFIANHRSYLDPAAMLSYIGQPVGFIAKKELLRVPVLGFGMGFVNVLAIDRSNRHRAIETMRAAAERLRAGISFVVFAEGTRAGRNELLPFKKGGFYMAVETGAEVVPVAIKNTDVLMGKGRGAARPGIIELVIRPPVETAGLSSDEDVKRLISQVHASIATELGLKEST